MLANALMYFYEIHEPDDDLGTAVQRLAEAGAAEALVLDAGNRPLGVVTSEGILQAWRRATLPTRH